ncbi:MAG: electron transfer flavoprotein subunit beta/FixA family protein [bacterium]
MKVAVCVKRVPDIAEADVRVDGSGRDVVRDRFQFTINEADNYALEEALLLKENHEAEVVLVTIGGTEATEVLRMGLAKGAERAVRIDSAGLEESDAQNLARVLAAFFRQEEFDLVLCGAIAQDTEDSQVGPALAGYLDLPHATYVTKLEPGEDELTVHRELEGGLLEVKALPRPCVVTIQTGGNTPRYASILGIKRAGAKPVAELTVEGLGLAAEEYGAAGSKTKLLKLYPPEVTGSAEMIEGDLPEKVTRVAEILKDRGVL